MIDKHIKEWLDGFNDFLDNNHPDIKGLYNERILFTPDAENQIHPHILPLSEEYASKEQIEKMMSVFDEYLRTHPI